MKLKEKIFKFAAQDGKPVRLSENEKIIIIINDNEWKTDTAFLKHSCERGVIYGYSLLQYFTPEKGSLKDKEGHTVKFLNAKKEPLNIIEIKTPGIWDPPIEVSVDYIKNFYKGVGIKNPENLFTDLSKQEKEALIAENKKMEDEIEKEKEKQRIADEKKKEEQRIADEKQKEEQRIADEKKKEEQRIADEKQKEDELKELIGEQYSLDMDGYKKRKSDLEKSGATEYMKNQYHTFYGKDMEENVVILFQATENLFEETQSDIESENPQMVEFSSFSEIDGDKNIKLNLETGDLEIKELKS